MQQQLIIVLTEKYYDDHLVLFLIQKIQFSR